MQGVVPYQHFHWHYMGSHEFDARYLIMGSSWPHTGLVAG